MHPEGSVRCKPRHVQNLFYSELIMLLLVCVLGWRCPRKSGQEVSTTFILGHCSSHRGCLCFCPQGHLNRELQEFTKPIKSKTVCGGTREEKGQQRDFAAFLTSGSCSAWCGWRGEGGNVFSEGLNLLK